MPVEQRKTDCYLMLSELSGLLLFTRSVVVVMKRFHSSLGVFAVSSERGIN